jgi:hypothetical protein
MAVRSLSPHLRGEGWGEGLGYVALTKLHSRVGEIREWRGWYELCALPLTRREDAATSPREGRGEVKSYPSARNSRLSTLPVAVIGSDSANCT